MLFIIFYVKREQLTIFEIEAMTKQANRLANRLLKLFSDKQITDVLKLSNSNRYDEEIPILYVWVADNLNEGYVAIENIANFSKMDKDKFEQNISSLFGGKYKRFAVISSELVLVQGDSYMLFHFEDVTTSNSLIVNDSESSLIPFVSEDKHVIKLANNLVWQADKTPHLSIIARMRAGKSVLAGRYMAQLMIMQGWTVEYNSAKFDRYVKKLNGKSTAIEIIERAEYWLEIMQKRLNEINEANKEKHLDMSNMNDIAIFFDELGNLNAELELDKPLKKRWETAINRLSATGASADIHIIAISQFVTKEGFLP